MFCSLGLVSLPIRVRKFSWMRALVSSSGAFIRILLCSGKPRRVLLPFSSALKRFITELVYETADQNNNLVQVK